MSQDRTEWRLYETVYEDGRVRAMLCPFCGVTVEAYKWSLAGSGKRCECGAVFGFHPQVSRRRSRPA